MRSKSSLPVRLSTGTGVHPAASSVWLQKNHRLVDVFTKSYDVPHEAVFCFLCCVWAHVLPPWWCWGVWQDKYSRVGVKLFFSSALVALIKSNLEEGEVEWERDGWVGGGGGVADARVFYLSSLLRSHRGVFSINENPGGWRRGTDSNLLVLPLSFFFYSPRPSDVNKERGLHGPHSPCTPSCFFRAESYSRP